MREYKFKGKLIYIQIYVINLFIFVILLKKNYYHFSHFVDEEGVVASLWQNSKTLFS